MEDDKVGQFLFGVLVFCTLVLFGLSVFAASQS